MKYLKILYLTNTIYIILTMIYKNINNKQL